MVHAESLYIVLHLYLEGLSSETSTVHASRMYDTDEISWYVLALFPHVERIVLPLSRLNVKGEKGKSQGRLCWPPTTVQFLLESG